MIFPPLAIGPNSHQRTSSEFRDGFRERGPKPSQFLGPNAGVTFVWPLVWKARKYAPLMRNCPSKIYLLWCWFWFYDCFL